MIKFSDPFEQFNRYYYILRVMCDLHLLSEKGFKESMPVYKKKWPQYQLRDVDMCLYKLLRMMRDFHLLSEKGFNSVLDLKYWNNW